MVVMYNITYFVVVFLVKQTLTDPPSVEVIMDPAVPVKSVDGVNVTAMCSVTSGNPPALLKVRWFLGDELLKELPECNYTSNDVDGGLYCNVDPSILSLVTVDQSFAGNYTCQGMNIFDWGQVSDPTELVVYYPPSPAKLTYTPSKVIKRGQVELQCSVDHPGRPKNLSYIWYRGKHKMSGVTTSKLTINPVKLDTRNNFTCKASNEGGIGDSATVFINVSAPPTFITPLKYQHVRSFQTNMSLTCRVECSPLCYILWFKGNDQIDTRNNPLYDIKTTIRDANATTGDFESIASTLIWNVDAWPTHPFVKTTPTANYMCMSSSNGIGNGVNASVAVEVEYPPENLTVSKPTVSVIEKTLPPTVACVGKGFPDLRYTWRKLSTGVILSETQMLSFKEGVTRKDSGFYLCEASNIHGVANTTMELLIEYAPECVITKGEYGGFPALLCTVDAVPQDVNFTWRVIHGTNDTFDEQLNTRQEYIRGFLLLDSDVDTVRTYQCTANNSAGLGDPCEMDVTEQCYTPEKQQGQCVPLQTCPKALEVFVKPPKGSETYLRQYLCGLEQGINVCCDNSTDLLVLAEQHSIYDSVEASAEILTRDALPDCDLETLSRTILTVIVAKNLDSDVEYTKCVGVRINAKYVITAAQCLAQDNKTQNFAISEVRFITPYSNDVFGIEENITHPFYDPATGVNDLALLRLNSTATFDDSVFGCLMDDDFQRSGYEIITYGGLDASTTKQWRTKTTISTTILSTKMCKDILQNKAVVVTEYDTCTEDFKNSSEASCNQYVGVPLFYKNGDTGSMRLIGISSSRFGCDDGLPDVYTNLLKYKGWLRDNMRPWLDDKQCPTQSGDGGQCQSIFYCPALLDKFSDARNTTNAYLSKLICKGGSYGETFSVCCPAPSNLTTFENGNDVQTINIPPEFIESRRCGLQQRGDYFSSSTVIARDEFPWIALIVEKWLFSYQDSSHFNFYPRCTGMLINARYVLTTASCVPIAIKDTIIRLGAYSYISRNDCAEHIGDCTAFEVEDIVRHPFYILNFNLNNVALLRLNKTVAYTDYIRPICLPVQGTVTAKPGDILSTLSWNFRFDETQQGLKKKIMTSLISNKECRRRFRNEFSIRFINERSVCTEGNKSTLKFNSEILEEGGALMSHHNYKWHLEGILADTVFNFDLPLQFVNISKYVNWILENMKPW